MDAKKLALLIGALLVAGITAFMAKNMFEGASAPKAAAAVAAPVESGTEILVATRALPIGTIIGPDSFRYQPWPKDLIQNAYYLKGAIDPNSLNGTVVRSQVTAGQPVTQGALVKPGDRGFLAAALGPGMRAVTVSVSAQSGVAGFIFPGDRVDLLLSQSVEGGEGPALRASETIIRNLRVLATDQRTVSEDAEGKREVKIFSTVTLESTARMAEKIAVAQSIGQLSLSLRSLADNNAELERAIASGEVTVPEGTDPKAEKQMLLAVASRPTDSGTTFVTGADVSRFQRRSVPRVASPASGNSASSGSSASTGAVDRPMGPIIKIWRPGRVEAVEVGGK
ncbi:MAG: Flp pilus assembly protein CpaB [Chakrabartia sp.]